MKKYTFIAHEVMIENTPCWQVSILRNGTEVVHTTTHMSEQGCRKWAVVGILKLEREESKSLTSDSSKCWIEETFGKKKKT